MTLVSHTLCTVDGISGGKIEISNIDESTGDITLMISGIRAPSGISHIEVPVWTQNNGQDDIVWYTAVKKGDAYQVKVSRKDHKNEFGKYTAHVYAYDNLGTSKLVTYLNFDMSDTVKEIYSCSGVSIENIDFTDGTFRVKISDVQASTGVQAVKVPVWSELNGQDDIIWYDAVKDGNSWYVDVNTIADHNVVKGTYFAHAYVVTSTGHEYLLGGTTAVIMWDLSLGTPGIDVSQWQGTIDWKAVKESGIDFAMIRTGYGYPEDDGGTDPKFEYNIQGRKSQWY